MSSILLETSEASALRATKAEIRKEPQRGLEKSPRYPEHYELAPAIAGLPQLFCPRARVFAFFSNSMGSANFFALNVQTGRAFVLFELR